MPTQAQIDQVTKQAVSVFAEMMQISELEAMQNHQNEIFHLVCAFAAQAS